MAAEVWIGSGSYPSFRSSVRYFGASIVTFSMNSACCFPSSFGECVVRVATGTRPYRIYDWALDASTKLHNPGLDHSALFINV